MRGILKLSLAGILAFASHIHGQAPGEPPLPSDLPPVITRPQPRIITPARQNSPGGVQIVRPQVRQIPGRPAPNTFPRYTPPSQLPDDVLAWDQVNKEYQAKPGELTAPFSFALTNVSNEELTINWVRPSCGCTVAKLPPTPWKLAPGEGGNIELNVDLRGKFGTLSKYVSVDTTKGQKMLGIKVHIPQGGQMAGGADARTRNMQLAMADRQVVFRGECASCHSAPAVGRMGGELFSAACAICHEAPHRATMVPDLQALTVVPTKEYWKHWITHGKPGSLMPAFSKEQGGPLTPEQIESLAQYLATEYPQQKVASANHDPHDGHDHAGHDHDHPPAPPAAGK